MSFLSFPKFFQAEAGLQAQLEANAEGPGHNRPLALMLFAYDVVTWFEQNPALSEVRATCVVKPLVCDNGTDVRVYHHLKITGDAPAKGLPGTQDDVDTFAMTRLPWKLMSTGSMLFTRKSPLIAAALNCAADDMSSLRVALFAIADEMDLAFESHSVIHDMGLASVFKG